MYDVYITMRCAVPVSGTTGFVFMHFGRSKMAWLSARCLAFCRMSAKVSTSSQALGNHMAGCLDFCGVPAKSHAFLVGIWQNAETSATCWWDGASLVSGWQNADLLAGPGRDLAECLQLGGDLARPTLGANQTHVNLPAYS